MNYEKAIEELQTIIKDLQNGSTNIDQLASKAKRAAELIELCKGRLRNTEKTIAEIFEKKEL